MKKVESAKNKKDVVAAFRTFCKKHLAFLIGLGALLVFAAVWEIVAVCMQQAWVLPRVEDVLVALGGLLAKPDFYRATGMTLLRSLLGFGIGFVLGVLLGILAGVRRGVRAALQPIVAFLRAAPTMALTLIIMVWFRQAYTPVCIGVLMVFPIIYATTADSIATADPDLLEMAKVYRMSRKNKLLHIYVPHATPMILSGATTAFALNIKATVSAEILALTPLSLGTGMKIAKDNFIEDGAAPVFAWLLVAVLLSVVFELLFKGVHKLLKRRYGNEA